MIGFSDFSADLKLSEVIDSLYFGAPKYVISIVESFFISSNNIFSKFDSVYDAFIEIGRNGIESVKELKLSKKISTVIEEICSKIKLPSVEIRGIMEITNQKTDGVEIIKKILLDELKKDSTIDITYLGAPKYRLSITSDNFKSAEKSLKPIIAEIQSNIEKKKGSFKFTREDSKKTREN